MWEVFRFLSSRLLIRRGFFFVRGSREVSETVTDDVTELVTMRASRRNPRVVDRKFHNFTVFPFKLDHLR